MIHQIRYFQEFCNYERAPGETKAGKAPYTNLRILSTKMNEQTRFIEKFVDSSLQKIHKNYMMNLMKRKILVLDAGQAEAIISNCIF